MVKAKGIILADADPVASVKKVSSTVFVRPSMLQHVEQGRGTEIDSQSGALVREARAMDIHTPYNEALTLLVKARVAYRQKVVSGQFSEFSQQDHAENSVHATRRIMGAQ